MHRQAADQVGQHGGTNRGLGEGCSHLERGSPTRRRDVSGEKGHLGVEGTGVPWFYLLAILNHLL